MGPISVIIFVSDPWEFGTQCGVGPFLGEIICRREDKLLIVLSSPLEYAGQHYVAMLASPRYARLLGSKFPTLESTPANLIFLSSKDDAVLREQIPVGSMPATGSISEVKNVVD